MTNLQNSVVDLFKDLCLSQVKEQLTENLIYFNPNPTSFICNGHLFAITSNKAFITDKMHPGYGLKLKFNYTFN